jgi:hypothetical protein
LFSPFGGGAGVSLWTPAEIATTGWYDAADVGTLTFDGETDRVAVWGDKSGNANHMETDLGRADNFIPTYDGSINGKTCISLNGDGTMENTLGSNGSPSGQATCHAAIYRQHNEQSTVKRLLNSPDTTWFIGPYSATHRVYNGGFVTGPSTSGTPIACTVFSKSAANLAVIWVNGTSYGSRTATNHPASYDIGHFGVVDTDVAEVISWNADDVETRQLVEGYLSWKWGIEATLPESHPYFGAAPTL